MKTAILALLSVLLLSGCASWKRARVKPASPESIAAAQKGLAEINEAVRGVVFTSPTKRPQ